MTEDEQDLRALYWRLLLGWNARDASTMATCFADTGTMIGFDGSVAEGPTAITAHLAPIFADHKTAAFVAIVRQARADGDFGMVRADVGMVPPGKSEINPATNTRHVVVARKGGDGWRIALFQNTPLRLDQDEAGRLAIAAELQATYKRVSAGGK